MDLTGDAFAILAIEYRAEDDEFIPAKTRNRCAFGRNVSQAARHFGQDAVAHRVAQQVIDLFEAIQIDPDQGKLGVRLDSHQRFNHRVVETGTVGQSRHHIGTRQMLHLLGQLSAGRRRVSWILTLVPPL